jgi:hypothetical protein
VLTFGYVLASASHVLARLPGRSLPVSAFWINGPVDGRRFKMGCVCWTWSARRCASPLPARVLPFRGDRFPTRSSDQTALFEEPDEGVHLSELACAGLSGRYRALTTQDPPVVRSFEPRSGMANGPTEVLITGRGFQPGTTVSWGGRAATSVEVLSSNFLRATAPAGTPLGQVTVATRSGTVTAPDPKPIEEVYDTAAISNDWSPQTGEMEDSGSQSFSYSAQDLASLGVTSGATIVHDGLRFTWPTPIGEPDAVMSRGQAVEVNGSGDTLGFLYAGQSVLSGTGAVLYADGTQQTYQIDAGAWTEQTPGREVVFTTHRNSHTYRRENPDVPSPAYVYYASVALDPNKQVKAVVLPFTVWPNARRLGRPRSQR